jgi:hypothetical protein
MMELHITPDGTVRCVYGEEIDLGSIGGLQITRASNVEPDEQGRWWADMSPMGGPVLGPYIRRSEALRAEYDWLLQEMLARPVA